ncbi:MAG: TldD/PmbA family protein [Deltaproteobacteria bacterium]|nr:TldD/PmbA family protein [Deltaproteobacteria bacterium]
MSNEEKELLDAARNVVRIAKQKGAQEVATSAGKSREVEVQWRDGALEKISEATSRSIGLQLYVDGRYASLSTSDLRPHALERFIEDAVALTRTLAPDPFRTITDAKLYEGRQAKDLGAEDPSYDSLSAAERLQQAKTLEALCRAERPFGKAPEILSVTSGVSDSQSVGARVHSNGFEGSRRQTSFWLSASVTLKDPDGRRPEEYGYGGARMQKDLPPLKDIAEQAMERAAGRIGSKKPESGVMTMIIENRSAGRMLGSFLGPANASSFQQKRSMFEGKLKTKVASALLDLTDDPFVHKGFGSRLWDGEGIASKTMPVIKAGVLENVYIDTYYGKKLGWAPTTRSTSNLAWKYGTKDLSGLMRDAKDAFLVTRFLGGNSNGTTGDFSFGVQGFRVRGGEKAESVGELNVSGNHIDLWHRLSAIGNDPYPYSSMRTPSLVFEKVQFAGA